MFTNSSQYPNHEFSKHIDNNFSFSNRVDCKPKETLVKMLQFTPVDGGIMLEPRLQEYIKRRKFYQDNNIKPSVSAEREFMIDQRDIRAIKSYFKGQQKNYGYIDTDNNADSNSNKYFPSKSFRDKDPRVQKLKKTNKNKKVSNMGMFVPDKNEHYYDEPARPINDILDGRDLEDKDFKGFEPYDSKFNPRIDNNINATTSSVPDISTLSNFDKRKSRYHVDDVLCTEHKNAKKRHRRREKNDKNIISYNMKDAIRNNYGVDTNEVDLDTYMMRGVPDHTSGSYGHRNPAEHYFDYIDPNYQSAENSVESWTRGGESTRLNNKKSKREAYKRDLM